MKSKARNIHIFNNMSRVQGRKLHAQPFGVMWLDAGDAPRFKELSKPFMSE